MPVGSFSAEAPGAAEQQQENANADSRVGSHAKNPAAEIDPITTRHILMLLKQENEEAGSGLLLRLFLVSGAGEDRQARILREPQIADGQFTKNKNRAARRFDGTGVRARGTQAGGRRIGFSFSRVCHKSIAPRGSTGSELLSVL
jgi:hypothetical protein